MANSEREAIKRLRDPLHVHEGAPPITPIGAFERHQRVDPVGTDEFPIAKRNQVSHATRHRRPIVIGTAPELVRWSGAQDQRQPVFQGLSENLAHRTGLESLHQSRQETLDHQALGVGLGQAV